MTVATSSFHKGELQAQDRAGTRGVALELSAGFGEKLSFARNHDAWLASQVFSVVASVHNSETWVTPVFGRPGFLTAPSEEEIHIRTESIMPQDPLLKALAEGDMPLSMLGIDLLKRTRHRINGKSVTASADDDNVLRFQVLEYSPNCPKYLNRREVHVSKEDAVVQDAHRVTGTVLTDDDTDMISRMDTLFIGTSYNGAADVNHRGGKPGFVRRISPTRIQWPEYRGNGTFFTSGNLEVNPSAGVSFLDFDNNTGDVLQLSGTAVVDWSHDGSMEGATRTITFDIEQVIRTFGATTHRWKLLDYSPYNPAVVVNGGSGEAVKSSFPVPVVLAKIVQESPVVKTFRWLAPRNIPFLPGQYATFEFPAIPGSSESSHIRTWTLSETPNSIRGDNTLDVSVKLKEGGLISTWLHNSNHAVVGETTVQLHGVQGEMTPIITIDDQSDVAKPAMIHAPKHLLLLSAGIGITPSLSIVRGLGAFELQNDTTITMIHVERHRTELPFQGELERRARNYKNFTMTNIITAQEGRLTKERLKELMPAEEASLQEAYICGPGKFMSDMTEHLVEFGVPAAKINIEAFDF